MKKIKSNQRRAHRLGGAAPRSPQVLRDEIPSGGVAGAGGHAHGVEPQSAGAGVAEDPGQYDVSPSCKG